jgi:muconolactone delta-isomerase
LTEAIIGRADGSCSRIDHLSDGAGMEYLVTMTTHVPDGISDLEVSDVRKREAAHTAELARARRVLRLWRPPLQPGEWRTLGLFVADGPGELEQLLASMPLRVWRTDEVTALSPHPNDPGPGRVPLAAGSAEFLTRFAVAIPPGTSEAAVEEATSGEARRTGELAAAGNLLRLWRLDETHNLGHWQARDETQLQGLLASLPMGDWLTVDTLAVTPHPSDPPTVESTTAGARAGRSG